MEFFIINIIVIMIIYLPCLAVATMDLDILAMLNTLTLEGQNLKLERLLQDPPVV